MEKILIIGCSGQIGSDLTTELRSRYGADNVFATDIKEPMEDIKNGGPFAILDALNYDEMLKFVEENEITQIYNLAAILSGNAEKMPIKAWDINMQALMNMLEIARQTKAKKVFWPSSIAVFGPSTPRFETPQDCVMDPNTVYGISKLAGERWGEYYYNRYKVDFRSLRYPGLISYKAEAGGGTTDYAVEIFYEAVKNKKYECFLSEKTALPMMFMPDAIKATIDLMEADAESLSRRSSYNVAGISFTPEEIAAEVKKRIPEFEISYKPDFRQAIADSWPACIDDEVARNDWDLKCEYDLSAMVDVMLEKIKEKLGIQEDIKNEINS
ncbi:MAG: NAD-dependent epimerase/dehydratase family protein [Hyphomicrobiales bacterium]